VLIQVILKQLDLIEDQTTVKTLHKKMAPPLVTLLSAESEIQYVALRNINLIVQKNPGILAHEVKVRLAQARQLLLHMLLSQVMALILGSNPTQPTGTSAILL